jgi:TRAP-type C4-dicarboxylate transport system substrate-binding protein
MKIARTALAVVTVATVVAGCQSGGATDKAGSATIQLRFATTTGVNDNGQSYGPQAFLDSLTRVSGGRIKVEVVSEYHQGDPKAESQLVAAIAAGEVDGGWPSTRAFAAAGIEHLRATEAPMTITSYAAEQDLVSGPVSAKLLDTLKGTGVQGLGLAVGPLRRPFAAKKPLLAVEDWKGARIRSFNSPMQSLAYKDLGAVPVFAGADWPEQIRDGRLDGAEMDVAQYAENNLGSVARHVVSNVVLWPKVFVLSMSQKRFDTLSRQQRDWVRTAAESAVQASVAGSHDERALAERLCGEGVRFSQASPAQLASLQAAVKPSLNTLAADPVDGPLLRDIQAIAAKHPATDDPMPSGCARTSAEASSGSANGAPLTASTLPDGQYRMEVSQDDLARQQLSNNDGATGIWTLLVRNATYQITCHPADLPGTDCGHAISSKVLDAGDLLGSGTTVQFVFRPERTARLSGCTLPVSEQEPGHCGPGGGFSMHWSLEGNQLTLKNDGPPTSFALKPWTKIG